MGVWPDHLDHDQRYEYTDEWITAVKRLWIEDSVTLDGRFFHLDDCRSRPHPGTMPTLICAGRSAAGLAFQAKHCDAAFLSSYDLDQLRATSQEVKTRADDLGRSIKTYAMLTIVMDDTDAKAEQRYARYGQGADAEALLNMQAAYSNTPEKRVTMSAKAMESGGFQTDVIIGSPDTLADKIATRLEYTTLDGLMLIFPDFHDDLEAFGELVLPELQSGDRVRQTTSVQS
jgi:pyrimidine oxygenase